jgi:hypothetical protein
MVIIAIATLRIVVTRSDAKNGRSVSLTASAPGTEDGTLPKGDRLKLFQAPEKPFIHAVASRPVIVAKPSDAPQKIISRHWHDPLATPKTAHSLHAKKWNQKQRQRQ